MVARINEIDNTYGKLTVISREVSNKRGKARWLCRCSCGNTAVVTGSYLRNGHTKSCGCLHPSTKVNELGNRHGKLKVVSEVLNYKKGHTYWLCKCECGGEKVVSGKDLRIGNTKSCGCIAKPEIDETGNKYGKLLVIKRVKNKDRNHSGAWWLCYCACGKEKAIRADVLRSGAAGSCGHCSRPSIIERNGFSKHQLFQTWNSMMSRCYNKNIPSYKNYGGRGIKVYEEWHSPISFYKWIEDNLGPRPENYSLDRINVYGNYEPGNLRWADSQEQVNNRRLVLLSEEEHELVMQFRCRENNTDAKKISVANVI